MSRMADLARWNQVDIVKSWNLDLQEQFELWADLKNKQGFSYEAQNKKVQQDFLIFLKSK